MTEKFRKVYTQLPCRIIDNRSPNRPDLDLLESVSSLVSRMYLMRTSASAPFLPSSPTSIGDKTGPRLVMNSLSSTRLLNVKMYIQ